MAENMDIGINITGNAQQQLSKIESQVNNVSKSFEALKTVLGTLAIGAIIQQVAAFADEITDTAAAFGLATSEVLAFSAALGASGGKGDNAVKIFQGIANSIDELNNGSVKTLQTFEKLGFSLAELGKMSESEIRNKVIIQLGEMKNKTEASALAMQMFGKAAVGVDFAKLATEIRNNQEEAKKYAGAIDTAGDAFDNMAKITKQLKLAFAEAFEPAFKMIAAIKVDTDDLSTTFKVLGVAIISIATAITLVRIATVSATTAMAVFNSVSSANPWVLGAKTIIAGLTAAGILIATNTDEQASGNKEAEKTGILTDKTVVKTAELNSKLKQQREETIKIGQEFKKVTESMELQYQLSLAARNQSQYQVQLIKAQFDIESKLQDRILAQKEKYNSYDEDKKKAESQANLDTIYNLTKQADRQKELVKNNMMNDILMKEVVSSGLASANNYIESNKAMMQLVQNSKLLTANGKEKLIIEQQSKIYLDAVTKLQQAINDSNFMDYDQKKKTLDLLSQTKSIEDVIALAKDKQTTIGADIVYQLQQQIKSTRELNEEQKKLYDNSRSFETGWKQAFNTYMDDATNAARIAGDIFNSMTNRMNSAIDNFVETGKFSFADFSRSIIQDLIKIELKAQATKLLGMITGGGGIIGGIASLLGFAEGGDPPVNRPSIVGENGPEIFVPKTAGTIIPNNGTASQMSAAAAGTTVNNYITNNISAIDSKSVAQMFAENRRTLLGTMQLAQKENSYAIR